MNEQVASRVVLLHPKAAFSTIRRRKNFYPLPPRNLRSGDIAFLCINGRNYFMAAVISLKNLTDKQRKVWRMRYRKGWRTRRIALEMGMSDSRKFSSRFDRRIGLNAETPSRREEAEEERGQEILCNLAVIQAGLFSSFFFSESRRLGVRLIFN